MERTKSGGWWIENVPKVARSEDCVLATAPLPWGELTAGECAQSGINIYAVQDDTQERS